MLASEGREQQLGSGLASLVSDLGYITEVLSTEYIPALDCSDCSSSAGLLFNSLHFRSEVPPPLLTVSGFYKESSVDVLVQENTLCNNAVEG